MNKYMGVGLIVFWGFLVTLQAQEARPRMGMNLSPVADWNAELPFVDLFHCTRPWVSQKEGEPWGKGPALDLDEHGWVKSLESGVFAEVPFFMGMPNHHPGGSFTMLYEGEGVIKFSGASVEAEEPGRIVVAIDPSQPVVWLKLVETNTENHVRNIRFLLPGHESTYQKEMFNPVFLARWKGMACLRFLDWMQTNHSKQIKWEDRSKTTDAFWSTEKGVPLEVMISLANQAKIDPWFCLPAMSDDNYIRQFASLVKEKLDPALKPHIEYSNEVWNAMFAQSKWAGDKALELGLGNPNPAMPWEGRARFYTHRSLEIFKIWEEVFGGKSRLVRILAWQTGTGAYWSDGLLLAHTAGAEDVDALAIGAYMGMNVFPSATSTEPLLDGEVAEWSVDQVMDYVEETSLPGIIKQIEVQKAVADKYGIKLMSYESGQHLVGIGMATANEKLTNLLHDANRSPRMGVVYGKLYDAWKEAGGDLICHYFSIGRWNKFGSWGIAEYYDQQPSKSAKYQAVLDWAKKRGQDVTFQLPLPVQESGN